MSRTNTVLLRKSCFPLSSLTAPGGTPPPGDPSPFSPGALPYGPHSVQCPEPSATRLPGKHCQKLPAVHNASCSLPSLCPRSASSALVPTDATGARTPKGCAGAGFPPTTRRLGRTTQAGLLKGSSLPTKEQGPDHWPSSWSPHLPGWALGPCRCPRGCAWDSPQRPAAHQRWQEAREGQPQDPGHKSPVSDQRR